MLVFLTSSCCVVFLLFINLTVIFAGNQTRLKVHLWDWCERAASFPPWQQIFGNHLLKLHWYCVYVLFLHTLDVEQKCMWQIIRKRLSLICISKYPFQPLTLSFYKRCFYSVSVWMWILNLWDRWSQTAARNLKDKIRFALLCQKCIFLNIKIIFFITVTQSLNFLSLIWNFKLP